MNSYLKLVPANKKMVVIHGIGGVMFFLISSLILIESAKATVAVDQNGREQTVRTHAKTVEDLLAELNIEVNEHDMLTHAKNEKIKNGMNIIYKEAKQIVLTVDGKSKSYFTTAKTLRDFFADEQMTISKHDDLSHNEHEIITENLHVSLQKAFQITLHDGKSEKKIWTTGGSINELLRKESVVLSSLDKIKPSTDKKLKKGLAIHITRVEKVVDKVEETIAFETKVKEDKSLKHGEEKVIEKGEKGKLLKTYEVTKENGEEVNREKVKEEVKKKSKNQIVAVGPKPVQESPSSEPGGKTFYMNATAYTAGCNGCTGITATGINLNANPNMKVIAVDPNVIPLGSKVWVEGYGYAIAGDTGGSIKGNRIDAHVPTKADATQFGRKKVKVKIVN